MGKFQWGPAVGGRWVGKRRRNFFCVYSIIIIIIFFFSSVAMRSFFKLPDSFSHRIIMYLIKFPHSSHNPHSPLPSPKQQYPGRAEASKRALFEIRRDEADWSLDAYTVNCVFYLFVCNWWVELGYG